MSNILIQFDWNNHKEMSQKKLTDMFMKLSLSDKKKVYAILSDKRKVVLRKGYDKWRKEQNKIRIDKGRKFVTLPLSDLIDVSDLKTNNEIMLTLGIILSDKGLGYYDNPSSNYHKELESFEKAKSKIINLFETMWIRRTGLPPSEEDAFYSQLERLEYIPPTTLPEILKWKKERWLRCYTYIGVGKERADRITNALARRLKIIESYDTDTYMATKETYWEWESKISERTKKDAIKYYSLTNAYSEED